MALNGTRIEFGKSEHVFRWRISRATTISADFIVLGQRCGQQVSGRKVYRVKRLYPVRPMRTDVGCQKSPVAKSGIYPVTGPLLCDWGIWNLCSSRQVGSWIGSIEVMSVDAAPVVKVEHLKELLPAQRPSSPRTALAP
jgi:hypothetical protein